MGLVTGTYSWFLTAAVVPLGLSILGGYLGSLAQKPISDGGYVGQKVTTLRVW